MSNSRELAVPYPSYEHFDVQTAEVVNRTFYSLLSHEGVELKESGNGQSDCESNLVCQALVWGCKRWLEFYRDLLEMQVVPLDITPLTLHESYHKHVNRLFENGPPSWGRLLILFTTSSLLAVRIYYSGRIEHVDNIKEWLHGFIVGTLKDWIIARYGWKSAVETLMHYQRDNNAIRRRSNRPWWYHDAALGVSAAIFLDINSDHWIN